MKLNQITLMQNSYRQIAFKGKRFAKDSPKVSVVLPIYNQEKYLPTALDSLRNQTLEETEFICVNDGSDATKDRSLEILHEYASKDDRVRVIDQKNQGAGCTRNNGMKIARGEYIAFLDPDDWFESEALQKMYEKAKRQNCDMLAFNFNRVEEETGEITRPFNIGERLRNFYPAFDENATFNWRDIKPAVFRGILWMAWNKIYNRDFVESNQLHFGKSSLAEDNIFVFDATLKARDIGYLDDYLYNYLQHEGSALHKKSDKCFCIFKAIDGVKGSLKKLGLSKELEKEFDNYVVRLLSIHAGQILSQDKLKEICERRLSPRQLEMLKEQHII